jgi:uncharacterized protein involved in outer membrane biogenesis
MKIWSKVIVTIIALVVVAYVLAAGFIAIAGKGLILSQIEQATHKKATLGAVRLLPLYTVELENLDVEKLVKADRVSVSPSLLLLLTGRIGLNSLVLVNPQFSLEINPPSSPESLEKAGQEAVASTQKEKAKAPDVFIKHFVLKNGTVDFFDKTVGTEGIRIHMKDINCAVSNVATFIVPQTTVFDLKATIPWEGKPEEGTIRLSGRLNLVKKDIQATVAVKNIDGIALYPYYAQWVDLKDMRFDQARLNFSSDIQGAGENVVAKCNIELADLRRKAPEEGEPNKKSQIADIIMGFAQAAGQNKLKFDFKVRTGFDKFNKIGFSGIKFGGGN